MGGKANSSKDKEERVVEPREVDILCGRGGLSNHHPGNEWYRRLIRSNRPLYRACPKHTKLLVSKAIVQAVEQQGGRFLERSRKDGFWYAVPYKRAVDKTSQGLRERERDDEGSGAAPVAVPAQFSGKAGSAPHKLSDLADVAIAQATRMDGLPRTASQLVGASGYRGPAAAAPAARGPVPPPTAATSPARPAASLMPPRGAAPPPAPLRGPPTTLQPQRMDTRDFAPLPPTMEPRQSSMFRLLRDTKLLPAESAYIMGPNSPSAVGGPLPARGPTLYPYGAAAAVAATAYAGAPPPAASPAAASAAAPALTRLTTQVSDWLNSFWPVPARGESTAAAAPLGGAPPPGGNTFARGAAATTPGYGGAVGPAPTKRVAPPIVNIPPPGPQKPIQINTIPPMSQKEEAAASQPADKVGREAGETYSVYADAAYKTYGGSTAASTSTQDGNKKENHDENKETDEAVEPPAPLDAPRPSLQPTELEHSVSATLLKLASTPSRFFSGISALFGEEEDVEKAKAASAPPPVATSTATSASMAVDNISSSPPIIAGTKRSKASLLDDDSDDERAAAVPPVKKRRTSLLDDYEESPREARMRTVYEMGS